MRICDTFLLICLTSTGIARGTQQTDILRNWWKWNQNLTKMSNNFHKFPYALIVFDKDISGYSRASALCSEQLAQLFRVYKGYIGSRITWSIYNFVHHNEKCTCTFEIGWIKKCRYVIWEQNFYKNCWYPIKNTYV